MYVGPRVYHEMHENDPDTARLMGVAKERCPICRPWWREGSTSAGFPTRQVRGEGDSDPMA